jgi:hypothetical protein
VAAEDGARTTVYGVVFYLQKENNGVEVVVYFGSTCPRLEASSLLTCLYTCSLRQPSLNSGSKVDIHFGVPYNISPVFAFGHAIMI